jgi:hypothetical protein
MVAMKWDDRTARKNAARVARGKEAEWRKRRDAKAHLVEYAKQKFGLALTTIAATPDEMPTVKRYQNPATQEIKVYGGRGKKQTYAGDTR